MFFYLYGLKVSGLNKSLLLEILLKHISERKNQMSSTDNVMAGSEKNLHSSKYLNETYNY